jgi:flagellin-specific chaperone FliS
MAKFIQNLPIDLQKATSINHLKKIFIDFQETLDIEERKIFSNMLNKFLTKLA